MTDITVKLDINATPPNPAVTCDPEQFSANRGNQEIKWKPGGDQGFTFSSLTGLTQDPPFSGLTVTNGEITIDDDDQSQGDYSYNIYVVASSNNQTYSTLPTTPAADTVVPCIKNK